MDNRLAELREAAGLSQTQLSAKSGVHPQMISKWERGDRDLRRAAFASVLALADALGVDPRELLKED